MQYWIPLSGVGLVVGAERIPQEALMSLQTSGRQERELNDSGGSISVGVECTVNVRRLSSWRGSQQPIKVPNGQNESDDLLQSNQDWFG